MLTIAPEAPDATEAPAKTVQTAEPRACRVRLTPGPVAAAQARRQVQAAMAAWHVPVDTDIAVLLTSDLVTHAIKRAPGGAVILGVSCTRASLRVDVHDYARTLPAQAVGRAGTRTRAPSLALVATLSTQWGCYQTPAGKVAYFTLAFTPAPTSASTPRVGLMSAAQIHAETVMTSTPTHAAAP